MPRRMKSHFSVDGNDILYKGRYVGYIDPPTSTLRDTVISAMHNIDDKKEQLEEEVERLADDIIVLRLELAKYEREAGDGQGDVE